MSFGQSEHTCNDYRAWKGQEPLCGNCAWPKIQHAALNPIELVKQSYDFPSCAWETPYAAQIGKRKLLSILRYLARREKSESLLSILRYQDRKTQPKNRVYRWNRKPVNNLWDVPR